MTSNGYWYPRARMLWWAALASLAASLAACGFHLRGPVHLPSQMHATYIQGGGRFSPLITDLRQSLNDSGVSVVDSPAQATAVLRILSQQANKRVLSVGADGRPRESELYSRVRFDVTDVKTGKPLLSPQTLEVRRNYLVSVTNVLGTASDEAFAREQMDRDLVRMMMMRLEALTR